MPTIVNMRDRPDLRRLVELRGDVGGLVRIDRRTRWGNPWVVGRDGSRAEVIERYRRDLWRRIRAGEIALEDLAALHANTHYLCWCHPLPCHGTVLARTAAWAATELGRST